MGGRFYAEKLRVKSDLFDSHKTKRAEYNGTTGIVVGYSVNHLIMAVEEDNTKRGITYGQMLDEDPYCFITKRGNTMGYMFVDECDLIK